MIYKQKTWSDYLTKDGQVGERKEQSLKGHYYVELGDGLQRLGFREEAYFLNGEGPYDFFKILELHKREPGTYVRSKAHSGDLYDDIRITSRDQMRSIIRATGYRAYQGYEQAQQAVREITWKLMVNFFFFRNTHDLDPKKREQRRSLLGDLSTPEVLAELVRANRFRTSYFTFLYYLILLPSDFYSLCDTIQRTHLRSNAHPKYADDDHQIGYICQSLKIMPTWIAHVNRWYYQRFRKVWIQYYDEFSHKLNRPKYAYSGAQYALDRKYTHLSAPPFNELWRPVIHKTFERQGIEWQVFAGIGTIVSSFGFLYYFLCS